MRSPEACRDRDWRESLYGCSLSDVVRVSADRAPSSSNPRGPASYIRGANVQGPESQKLGS